MSKALKRAIAIAGSQELLAKAIGVRQQLISYALLHSKRGVPAEWAPRIEGATGGAVSRSDLRPDLWPKAPEAAE